MSPRTSFAAPLLVLLVACGGTSAQGASTDAGSVAANDATLGDAAAPASVQPTPVATGCNVSCASVAVVGPVSELSPPFEESAGDSAVTFGGDHWYVAWGGRPAIATHVQRFTAAGDIDGPAKLLSGTTPLQLTWRPSGELLLFGWVPPAYTKAGTMESMHRFGPALEPVAEPVLLRSPGDGIFERTYEITAAGQLVTTRTLNRPGPLIRELTLDPSASAQSPLRRDWYVSGTKSSFVSVERIGADRFAVDYDGAGIRVTPLADSGVLGRPSRVLEASFEAGNVVVWTKQIGGTWWVGGYSARAGATTVHLRAVDPKTRAGIGDPIAIAWPQGMPISLIDANGTPVILGHLEASTSPIRPSLVPIDVAARAACRASTIVVDPHRDQYQTIRAVHFAGDTAGVTLDTWSGSGPRRMFFARLACQRGG